MMKYPKDRVVIHRTFPPHWEDTALCPECNIKMTLTFGVDTDNPGQWCQTWKCKSCNGEVRRLVDPEFMLEALRLPGTYKGERIRDALS